MKDNIVKEKSYAFALRMIKGYKYLADVLNSQFSILNLDNSQFSINEVLN
jgi:hypothetical protein